MSKLLLVRHGRTKLHQDDRFWGKTDVALSEIGIRQAENLRDRLASEKIQAIYTSKLSRARITADIIGSRHEAAVTACTELAEANFGYVEGLTFREVQRLHPKLADDLNSWSARPKFPGGESIDDLDTRVQSFLNRLKKHRQKETLLIVAHGGTLQLMICHLLGIDMKHWRKLRLSQGSLSIIETYPQGSIVNCLNDVSHLAKQAD